MLDQYLHGLRMAFDAAHISAVWPFLRLGGVHLSAAFEEELDGFSGA